MFHIRRIWKQALFYLFFRWNHQQNAPKSANPICSVDFDFVCFLSQCFRIHQLEYRPQSIFICCHAVSWPSIKNNSSWCKWCSNMCNSRNTDYVGSIFFKANQILSTLICKAKVSFSQPLIKCIFYMNEISIDRES